MATMRFQDKVALAAGSAAVAVSPLAAEAALVTVQGAPVSLALGAALGATVAWDVDGVGGREFEMFMAGGSFSTTFGASGFFSSYRRQMQFASQNSGGAPLNGRGLIAPFNTDNVQALPASFNVGPTLAAYTWGAGATGGYRYRAGLYSNRSYSRTASGAFGFSSSSVTAFSYDWNYGFVPGDNFFGFRFDDGVGGGLNYGWAIMNFDLTPGSESMTVVEWTYETQDDTAVHVGTRAGVAVPEPAAVLPSLALLALGAAGVRGWRRRKAETKAA